MRETIGARTLDSMVAASEFWDAIASYRGATFQWALEEQLREAQAIEARSRFGVELDLSPDGWDALRHAGRFAGKFRGDPKPKERIKAKSDQLGRALGALAGHACYLAVGVNRTATDWFEGWMFENRRFPTYAQARNAGATDPVHCVFEPVAVQESSRTVTFWIPKRSGQTVPLPLPGV